jgi:putative oxidoreductase
MPILNRGEVPVLLCFIFLYLVFAGAGVWSVDSLIKSSRRPNAAPTPGAPT